MKNHLLLLCGASLLLRVNAVTQQHGVQAPIFGAGGGITAGQAYRISHTLGLAIAGPAAGPAFRVQSGFWAGAQNLVLAVEGEPLPAEFRLLQNFPNPFNPSTTIRFEVPILVDVELRVYDALGREVNTLVRGQHLPGRYEIIFEPRTLASGVYFYRIRAGTYVATKKLVLLR